MGELYIDRSLSKAQMGFQTRPPEGSALERRYVDI